MGVLLGMLCVHPLPSVGTKSPRATQVGAGPPSPVAQEVMKTMDKELDFFSSEDNHPAISSSNNW